MTVTRTYKTIGFSVPPTMARRIDALVKARQSTRSEFFREMFRAWEQQAQRDRDSDQAILRLATQVQAAERNRPTPKRDTRRFFAALGEDLRQRAQRRGLTLREDGALSDPARP